MQKFKREVEQCLPMLKKARGWTDLEKLEREGKVKNYECVIPGGAAHVSWVKSDWGNTQGGFEKYKNKVIQSMHRDYKQATVSIEKTIRTNYLSRIDTWYPSKSTA